MKTLGQGRKEIARHIFKLDGVALLSARSTRDELFTTESWGPLHDKNSLLAEFMVSYFLGSSWHRVHIDLLWLLMLPDT